MTGEEMIFMYWPGRHNLGRLATGAHLTGALRVGVSLINFRYSYGFQLNILAEQEEIFDEERVIPLILKFLSGTTLVSH